MLDRRSLTKGMNYDAVMGGHIGAKSETALGAEESIAWHGLRRLAA
jgi:hypothetical protein